MQKIYKCPDEIGRIGYTTYISLVGFYENLCENYLLINLFFINKLNIYQYAMRDITDELFIIIFETI